MGSILKLSGSCLLIFIGIWLLMPNLPVLKPANMFIVDLIWWPQLWILVKGIIPIGLFAFGVLLLWIEYDEYRSGKSRGRENSEENKVEGNEMPAFEDVEYKDLECPECEDKFKTDIGLKVHRKVNHPDEFEKNPDPYSEK